MSQDEIFKCVEKRLRAYPSDVDRLLEMNERLEKLWVSGSVHGMNYDAICAGGCLHSDPVANYYELLEKAERDYQKLLHDVEPISRLIEDLYNPDALDALMNEYHTIILERYYFQQMPLTELLKITHWSRTAFYARRYDLVNRAREYMRL